MNNSQKQSKQPLPPEWVKCPVCGLPYSFLKPLVTTYPSGERKDQCLSCGVKEERKNPPMNEKVPAKDLVATTYVADKP